MATAAIEVDPWREVDAIPLLLEAQRQPLAVLCALVAGDGLLAQASAIAASVRITREQARAGTVAA